MSYYDNVKDSIRDNNKEGKSKSSGSGPSFDTLKKAAEETSEEEKEEKDNTPIEVLEEDGIQPRSSSKSSRNNNNPNQNRNSANRPVQDNSNLEEKLDTLIEQNKEIIEILRSFGN